MKKFFDKLFKKSTSDKGPKNLLAIRYGSYTAVVAVVAVVLLIGVNILATLLSDRLPIDIDLTAEKENTVSEENLEIIKDVKNDVTVTVCASQDGYVGEYMAYFAENLYQAEDSTVGCKYYQQTINLVKEYAKYNTKIKVKFIDVQDPAFSEIAANHPNHSFVYGDILVESPAFNEDGTPRLNEVGVQMVNSTFIQYDDIYSLSDPTGYAAYGYSNYTVAGNAIETQLTSAIYSVTSTETVNMGVVTGHGDISAFDTFGGKLSMNNYEFIEVDENIITKIDKEIDVLTIIAPTADFTGEEIAVIEKFLDNDGKKGKGLMFFASAYSPDLPNLYAFLQEWGVKIDSSKVMFETDEQNFLNAPSQIGLITTESKVVEDVAKNNYFYLAGDNVYMKPAFEESGKRTTEEIVKTSETVVAVPKGSQSDIDTSKFEKEQTSAAIITTETVEDQDYNALCSYVACFASEDFVSANWAENTRVGNMDVSITVANYLAGRDADVVYFSPKTITNESFADKISQAKVNIVKIIVLVVVPLAVIATAVVVIIKRRRK